MMRATSLLRVWVPAVAIAIACACARAETTGVAGSPAAIDFRAEIAFQRGKRGRKIDQYFGLAFVDGLNLSDDFGGLAHGLPAPITCHAVHTRSQDLK